MARPNTERASPWVAETSSSSSQISHCGRGDPQDIPDLRAHDSPPPPSALPRGKVASDLTRKPRDESPMALVCAWVVEHQLGLAINLLLLLALTHACLPRARRHTRKFFELSYYDDSTGRYGTGWNDLSMVFYWIVLFTGLRVGVMDFVLIPFAQWGGVRRQKARIRFAEQGWSFFYYGIFWALGVYIYSHSSYRFNLREVWTGWPNRQMDGLSKWYYLVQFAFYLQQIVVVNIEARRKDYAQMFTHHIITCVLIYTSYGYLQTKVGNVILCLMDVVDIILPLAKMLKYLHYQMACDVAFVVFMLAWFIARHILYPIVVWSAYADLPTIVPNGCFSGEHGQLVGPFPPPDRFLHLVQPFLDPSGTICWNDHILWTFLAMLLILQVMALVWFGMIMRVAWRVINGGVAEDSRSDDDEEGDGEEDEASMRKEELQGLLRAQMAHKKLSPQSLYRATDLIDVPAPGPFFEEEVGVESISLKGRTSSTTRRYKKGGGSSSVAAIPGHSHSDRKDLLGRIGCDKTA